MFAVLPYEPDAVADLAYTIHATHMVSDEFSVSVFAKIHNQWRHLQIPNSVIIRAESPGGSSLNVTVYRRYYDSLKIVPVVKEPNYAYRS